VPLRVSDTVIKDVMKDVLAKIDEKARGDDDDITAIKTAIDFEAKGASFYAKLRDGVSDDKEKEFFNLLANIEHEHYMSLKETEEFLLIRLRGIPRQSIMGWMAHKYHVGLILPITSHSLCALKGGSVSSAGEMLRVI